MVYTQAIIWCFGDEQTERLSQVLGDCQNIFHESLWGLWCSADDADDDEEEEEDLVKAFCPKVSVRQYNLCPDTCPVWQQHLIIRARLSSFENHNEGDYDTPLIWQHRMIRERPICNTMQFVCKINFVNFFSQKSLLSKLFFSSLLVISRSHGLSALMGHEGQRASSLKSGPKETHRLLVVIQ